MSQIPQSVDKILISKIREVSVSRLAKISHLKTIHTFEVLETWPVLAHRMAVILVSGRKFRMTFKAQFSSDSARFFAHQAYNVDESEVTIAQAEDFVREFCNTVAGHIKSGLVKNSVQVGLSLPTIARGFDNFYFREPSGESVFKDRWKLASHQAEIYCTVQIEILSPITLDEKLMDIEDSGEVDFL